MGNARILLACLLLLFLSCKEKQPILTEDILEPTPLISDDRQWAVIQDPYLNLLEIPELTSESLLTMRQGEVAEILEVRLLDGEPWCLLQYNEKQGWAPSVDLGIYRRRAQAETAAVKLLAD